MLIIGVAALLQRSFEAESSFAADGSDRHLAIYLASLNCPINLDL